MLSCIGLYLNRMLGLQMNTIYTGTWEQFFTITLVFERVPEITVHQIVTTKIHFISIIELGINSIILVSPEFPDMAKTLWACL